jgi:Major Facilitator Superfamily
MLDFGWRMIFWVLTAMGGLVLILIILFLPETSRKHIQSHQEKTINPTEDTVSTLTSESTLAAPEKPSSKTLDPSYEKFSVGLVRPLKFLMKPVVILSSLPYALAFGFMYFIISTLPHQLGYKYNFNTGQIGLAYLANGIGNAMGAVFGGQYSDWFVARQIRKSSDGKKIPEMRIGAMWIGIVMIPIGDLIYGWCLQYRTSVWLVLFGFFISKIQLSSLLPQCLYCTSY